MKEPLNFKRNFIKFDDFFIDKDQCSAAWKISKTNQKNRKNVSAQ